MYFTWPDSGNSGTGSPIVLGQGTSSNCGTGGTASCCGIKKDSGGGSVRKRGLPDCSDCSLQMFKDLDILKSDNIGTFRTCKKAIPYIHWPIGPVLASVQLVPGLVLWSHQRTCVLERIEAVTCHQISSDFHVAHGRNKRNAMCELSQRKLAAVLLDSEEPCMPKVRSFQKDTFDNRMTWDDFGYLDRIQRLPGHAANDCDYMATSSSCSQSCRPNPGMQMMQAIFPLKWRFPQPQRVISIRSGLQRVRKMLQLRRWISYFLGNKHCGALD